VQDDIVARYKPATAPSVDQGAERTSQLSREQTAYRFIFVDSKSRLNSSPLQWLNLYTKKTKASLLEDHAQRPNRGFVCSLTYQSILRSIKVEGHGTTKKAAKNEAASGMLAALKKATQA
jgi:dsRNA-specific ribonuclease